ncbi:hypothetical protein M3P05_13705 [Sansalvadorimonas sp. 2012CJ34-2]|uniref:Uncharacterized protein n=1 Tax=Parendozoicomonas callyspongiae TaxID=2942213 RepID=A0ABT0PI94_9GAMM|nr:hypothetical protein [Sansalvadorimonas sp. 2012CJ34-2]MCL6270981.1 hypothetical protein [Sansalvadorimonas sp. 2012CJ34-2]
MLPVEIQSWRIQLESSPTDEVIKLAEKFEDNKDKVDMVSHLNIMYSRGIIIDRFIHGVDYSISGEGAIGAEKNLGVYSFVGEDIGKDKDLINFDMGKPEGGVSFLWSRQEGGGQTLTAEERIPDSDSNVTLSAVSQDSIASYYASLSEVYAQKSRFSKLLLDMVRKGHHRPNMKMLFMFGSNQASLLNNVCQTKQATDTFCFLNPIMRDVLCSSKGMCQFVTAQGQQLKPVINEHGEVYQVIQSDPPGDANACGVEHCFTLSRDRKTWSRIEYKYPGRPSIIGYAQA